MRRMRAQKPFIRVAPRVRKFSNFLAVGPGWRIRLPLVPVASTRAEGGVGGVPPSHMWPTCRGAGEGVPVTGRPPGLALGERVRGWRTRLFSELELEKSRF